jgi:hypothetical protein
MLCPFLTSKLVNSHILVCQNVNPPTLALKTCILRRRLQMSNYKRNPCIRGRLHGAFSMCVFMSDKPFVAEACPPKSHASASNGLSDIETHIKIAPCNRPLSKDLRHNIGFVAQERLMPEGFSPRVFYRSPSDIYS